MMHNDIPISPSHPKKSYIKKFQIHIQIPLKMMHSDLPNPQSHPKKIKLNIVHIRAWAQVPNCLQKHFDNYVHNAKVMKLLLFEQ